jgi:hypothetical protein
MTAVKMPPMQLSPEALTALVFELASQLQIERAHRITLEVALEEAGLVGADARASAAQAQRRRDRSIEGANLSLKKLFRAMSGAAEPHPTNLEEGLA